MRPRYLELQAPSDFSEGSVYATAQEYKPGIPTEELVAAGREAVAAPELDVLGLMSHLGRHRNDLETWRAYAASAGETVGGARGRVGRLAAARARSRRRLCRAARPEHLGLRRRRRRSRRAPAIEDVVEALASGLRAGLAGRVPLDGVALEIEPGRALHADTGIHLTRVVNLKRQTRAAGLELGRDRHDRDVPARPARRALPLPGRRRRRAWTEPAGAPVDVVGCSCGFDVLAHQVRLPQAEIGDTLAFLDTGAYEDACAANFNALPRPAIVLVSGADAEIVRRAETIEDVFARDVDAGAAAPVTVRGIDHAGITVGERRRRARLLSRPARPARDRRGRGRGARAGRDHRPDAACACATPSSTSAAGSCSRSSSTSRRTVRRSSQRPCDPGASHLALRVDDVDALWERLGAAGVTVAGRPTTISAPGAWHGARCVYVEDPDGRSVELIQRPLTAWVSAPLTPQVSATR